MPICCAGSSLCKDSFLPLLAARKCSDCLRLCHDICEIEDESAPVDKRNVCPNCWLVRIEEKEKAAAAKLPVDTAVTAGGVDEKPSPGGGSPHSPSKVSTGRPGIIVCGVDITQPHEAWNFEYHVPDRGKKSPWWNAYHLGTNENGQNVAYCNLCGSRQRWHGGTTTLKRHIMSAHKEVYNVLVVLEAAPILPNPNKRKSSTGSASGGAAGLKYAKRRNPSDPSAPYFTSNGKRRDPVIDLDDENITDRNKYGYTWCVPSAAEFRAKTAKSSSSSKARTPAVSSERDDKAGIARTILTALRAAKVQFIRFAALDCTNQIRCKAVPIHKLLQQPHNFYKFGASLAEACFAGMPNYKDVIVPRCQLSAERVLTLRPDWGAIRFLPYAPSHAMALCSLQQQISGDPSPLCTRHLLQRVKHSAEMDFGLGFTVGAELEFSLVDPTKIKHGADFHTANSMDVSCLASTQLLNRQEAFVKDLHEALVAQDIGVEEIHGESAPGQMEVVLEKQEDVMRIADNVVLARETIQSCARNHNLRSLFLPKPSPHHAGNGMHLHISFRHLNAKHYEDRKNAFRNNSSKSYNSTTTGWAEMLSLHGSAFVEGVLCHLPALLSLTLPSINSFRRIGPNNFTGHTVDWAVEDKEAPIRICLDALRRGGQPSNMEYKLADATANIYLVLSVVVAAGLDGIARKLPLRPPMMSAREKMVKREEDDLETLNQGGQQKSSGGEGDGDDPDGDEDEAGGDKEQAPDMTTDDQDSNSNQAKDDGGSTTLSTNDGGNDNEDDDMDDKDELQALPKTFQESLECLKEDEFLRDVLGDELYVGYFAVKAAEVEKSSKFGMKEEVEIALARA